MEIEKFALVNAIKYNGKASVGSVLGPLLGEHPELKKDVKKIIGTVNDVIKQVNKLSVKEQKARLKQIAPDYKKKDTKRDNLELDKLHGAEMGKVVTRTAPNPNGAIHLGNARAAVLSFLYAQKFKGKFVLRFDDTSPKTKPPLAEAYKWIQEDLEWLGARIDIVHYACKNFERYYEVAEKLIKGGNAYICICDAEEWRAKKEKGIACPCRELPPEEQMKRWKRMFTEFKEGDAVLRIKTDLKHKDPSRRDWWAAKVIDNPNHPITKNKYRVWPSYNLQSVIDDHDLGITHIIRGQEHNQNELRQKYVCRYLGWTYPIAIHHGRIILESGGLSTSKTRELIAKGEYSGWDDPRLLTIRALRRRGFQPGAIRDIEISIGLNTNDAIVSADRLAAFNRKYIDKQANRYMFVANPIKVKIEGAPKIIANLVNHPDFPERGTRKLKTSGEFFITKHDFAKLKDKQLYRLMDCLNFRKQGKKFVFVSKDVKDYKKQGKGILHWVDDGAAGEVLMPDGTTVKGFGEAALKQLKPGTIVQFNRFGFVKLEAGSKFIFTHN